MASGSRRMQYVAAVSASLGYMANGMIGGWPSPMMPRLEAEDSPVPLTSDEAAWITSIASLTTILPILLVPYTVDMIGRKKLLLVAAIPMVIHWFMIAFADSFGVILAARIVASLGGGLFTTVGPMYLSEIAESKIRGAVGTMHQVLANCGTVFMFSIAPYTSMTVSAFVACSVALLFMLTFVWMPDSPYFFMQRGREEDTVKALMWLREEKDRAKLDEEVATIKRGIDLKQATKGKYKDLFQQRVHRRTFFLMSGLAILQLMSGSSTLMSYSTTIFENSGSSFDSNISSIIVAVVQLIMCVVCTVLVDRVGRRPLMIGTFIGCGVTMAAEGTYFYFEEVHGGVPSAFDWVPLTALIAYQISFWVGIGTVLSTILVEIYHPSVKGLGTSINTVVNDLLAFGLKRVFQVITDSVGTFCVFWGFTGFCFIGAAYSFFLLPETKGKTFAQINEEMDARVAGEIRHDEDGHEKEVPIK